MTMEWSVFGEEDTAADSSVVVVASRVVESNDKKDVDVFLSFVFQPNAAVDAIIQYGDGDSAHEVVLERFRMTGGKAIRLESYKSATTETHAYSNGKYSLLLFLLSSHSFFLFFFFFFSHFTVIRCDSTVDLTHSVVVASSARLAVCPVRPMRVVPCATLCAPVPTGTPPTATRVVADTANESSICCEGRRGSLDQTDHPTWSPANLVKPGELQFRPTNFSHSFLLFFSADLERRSVAATTKGHQQTWGQVSARFNLHCTHSFLSLFQASLAGCNAKVRCALECSSVCLCVSSSSFSYHGSAHVFVCVCVRLRPMVPSMFIHAFAPCVVVLVLPWFRPCLCVYIFVLVRRRRRTRTMVPPRCRLCGFACVFVPSYSYHGPAHVSVRLRPMVPSMFIHVCVACVVVRRRTRTRTRTMVPPRCRLRVFACVFVPWFRPCSSMCVLLVLSCSSLHGFAHVYVCIS